MKIITNLLFSKSWNTFDVVMWAILIFIIYPLIGWWFLIPAFIVGAISAIGETLNDRM